MLQLTSANGYLDFFAEWSPGRIAFVDDGVETSYAEAAEQVRDYARALRQWNVCPGDIVSVYGHSRVECFLLFLACMQLEAVFMGLNPKYSKRELAFFVGDAAPKVVIDCSSDTDSEKMKAVIEEGTGATTYVSLEEVISTTERPTDGGALEPCLPPSFDRPSVIVYTSGTTGTPKAAMLAERALCISAELTAQTWYGGIVPSTVSDKPINHLGWLVCVCLSALVRGGTLYFEQKFDARRVLELIAGGKINSWLSSAILLRKVAELPEFADADLSALETLGISAPTNPGLVQPFLDRSGARPANSYGLTEASGGVVTASRADATVLDATSTVGAPVPGIELQIVDGQGNPVADGQAGEIWVRGPVVFLGYRGDPEATDATMAADGWLRSGDIAVRRQDGNIQLAGRAKEMYKSGGINVYPAEVEHAVLEHPEISQAVVVGIPDEEWGEIGVAVLIPVPGAEVDPGVLKSFLLERLANHKVPKRFVTVEQYPLLASGKPDRREIRMNAASGDFTSHYVVLSERTDRGYGTDPTMEEAR